MRSGIMTIGLTICLVAFVVGVSVADGTTATTSKVEAGTIITGVVDSRAGSIVKMTADDGKAYTVDVTGAVVLVENEVGNAVCIRAGDKIRFYGAPTSAGTFKALRANILAPVENVQASVSSGTGAGPTIDDSEVRIPSVGDDLGSWRNRGLVLAVQYSNRMITIATSNGAFTIDASIATIVKSSKSVALSGVTQGDIVRIWGEVSGLNRVRADRIDVIGQKVTQDAALPINTVATKGVITYIDYPSYSFKINTDVGELRITTDDDTFIHARLDRKAFMNLQIGQTVKVVAMGNLNSGYVASEVVIVSAPRG